MKTTKLSGISQPVLTQAKTNTTLWIGHLPTHPTDHFGGQTFRCPVEGSLDNIQLFFSAIQYPGKITLTIHEFDNTTKTWGTPIESSDLLVKKDDHDRWVQFDFSYIRLEKDKVYGFRLQSANALVGIGEAESETKSPYTFGHQWKADSKNERGNYFSYFSLAFKIEMTT